MLGTSGKLFCAFYCLTLFLCRTCFLCFPFLSVSRYFSRFLFPFLACFALSFSHHLKTSELACRLFGYNKHNNTQHWEYLNIMYFFALHLSHTDSRPCVRQSPLITIVLFLEAFSSLEQEHIQGTLICVTYRSTKQSNRDKQRQQKPRRLNRQQKPYREQRVL